MQRQKLNEIIIPEGAQEVYLQPGEYFWGGENYRIKTLLGSCVAICVWHPVRRIGGMSHCLLPTRGAERTHELSGRYVDETFEIFFKEIQRSLTDRHSYVVKIFGGGNMFELGGESAITIGDRNLKEMREILKRNAMHIEAEHVGGKGHRNVIFELWSGDCWMKYGEAK